MQTVNWEKVFAVIVEGTGKYCLREEGWVFKRRGYGKQALIGKRRRKKMKKKGRGLNKRKRRAGSGGEGRRRRDGGGGKIGIKEDG